VRKAAVATLPLPHGVREAIEDFLQRISERAGDRVREVILYGSMARGDAGPESDVDLLVVWDGARADARDVLSGTATDIFLRRGVDLSPHPVTLEHLADLRAMRTAFYEEVERDGVQLS